MASLSVSALHVYPIKGCRGLDLKAVRFDFLGPLYDRRFMLVDDTGKYLAQRTVPKLALIEPKLGPTALQVSARGMQPLKVPMTQRDAKRVSVQIWEHQCEAEHAGASAAAWFSEFLEQSVRLVRLPEDAMRRVDERYTKTPALVGFADGFPVLLMSESSLADLNGKLQQPVPMNRFRPSLVVRGAEPYAEDRWKRIRVGEVELDVVKACKRCVTINVDQLSAQTSDEPLKTLAGYRTQGNGAYLGQNCIHQSMGSIKIDDPVEVLEEAQA